MTRAAIYARFSSDLQSPTSIEDQVRLADELIRKNGWALVRTYTDYALSGAFMMHRPGIKEMIADASTGAFDIIVGEALDRFSRDQEDVAHIYKRLDFSGVQIFTQSEGQITPLHIGLKGTMNAMFLTDLKLKVKRGQRGRVEKGMAGGGNSFGYDVVRKFDERGEPVRGLRVINAAEAVIVRRIFQEYVDGHSPKAIARRLNDEGVAGPSGKGWSPSTINGNWQRGTGILNNALYVGEIVWNKVSYPRNPDTGKAVTRVNPESEWVRVAAPDLAIIEREIWDKVQAFRTHQRKSSTKFYEKQRPKYLFSQLLRCGRCNGSVSKISQTHYGCSAARLKGPALCTNRQTVSRGDLENTVLSVLKDRLMNPELLAEFCAEYVAHLNRLRMERNSSLEGYRSALAALEVREDRMVRAIMDGFATPKLKEEMDQLLVRRAELQSLIDNTEEAPVLLHPNMAQRYKAEVATLIQSLNSDEHRAEATRLIRSLVERVVLNPGSSNFNGVTIDVYGDLAGIINIASKNDAKTKREPDLKQISLMLGREPEHHSVNQGKLVGLEASRLHFRRRGKASGVTPLLNEFNIKQGKMVELSGIEPLASSLRTTRSPN